MKLRDKIWSLIVVVIMMLAAAIAVNKSLAGIPIAEKSDSQSKGEISGSSNNQIEQLLDGTVILHTKGLDKCINGYAGPVNLDIKIKDGKIVEIVPLENMETPPFFEKATSLIPSWIGKTPEEALAMRADAVSGATYSSNAIINNLDACLEFYVGHEATKKQTTGNWKLWIALAIVLCACIIPIFVRNKIYHNIQLIANVIILGFWTGQYLDYYLMLKYLSDGMSIPMGLVSAVMLIAAFIYPLFGRPQHYCNHICPFGSAQQLVGEICGYKIKIGQKALKGLDLFRRILWGALMIMLWGDLMTEWMDFELFRAFQFESASWWIIGIALIFLALSAIVNRPYCRFVCPTGSLFKRSENLG